MTITLNEQEIGNLIENMGTAISKIEDGFNEYERLIATATVDQSELYQQIQQLKSFQMLLEDRKELDSTDMKEIVLAQKVEEKEELEHNIQMLLLELGENSLNKAKSEDELAEDGAFIRELMVKVEKIDVVIAVLGDDLEDEYIYNDLDDELED